MGEIDGITGDMHITGIDSSTASGTSTGHSTVTMSSGSSSYTTTDATLRFYTDEHGNLVDSDGINMVGPDLIDDEEEVSEEVQEKINKLGTPGKRNIDDLLNSFKVVADSKKGAPLEELDDQGWIDDVLAKDVKRHHEDVRATSSGVHPERES
mgnify:CR=1 FL=1